MLDWEMWEEHAAWPPVVETAPSVALARRFPRRWRWWALGMVLALLVPALVIGYQEARRAAQTMTRVENAVRAAVAADAWLAQHPGQTSTTTVAPTNPDLEADHVAGQEARRVEVRGDYALVEMWQNESDMRWMPVPYRWTRFYRETAQGWQRVAAPDVFYQPLATLQVGRFTFVYGLRDADAVQVAAAQIAAVDVEIRMELGLPLSDEALTIKIITDTLSRSDPVELAHIYDGAQLIAPSPALLRLPAHISEGDALLQLAAGLLAQRDLDEALAESSDTCNWQSLAEGVRRWVFYEHSKLPSWSRYQADRLLQTQMRRGKLPRLASIGPDPIACAPNRNAQNRVGIHTNDGAAASLIEYAVRIYGRDRLPALIEGMPRYNSWETLIPAVYGVSAAEFEAGWQEELSKDEG